MKGSKASEMPMISIYMIANYILVIVQEYLQYYYIYLLLSLPPWLFNSGKTIYINDGDSSNNDLYMREIWFIQSKLIIETYPNQFTTEYLSGHQLMLMSDVNGYISFNMLETYYPRLDTLYLQYLDLNPSNYTDDDNTIIYSSIDGKTNKLLTKIIDIKKRLDIRSGKKCKFGRIQI